jgi:hypothetical protein
MDSTFALPWRVEIATIAVHAVCAATVVPGGAARATMTIVAIRAVSRSGWIPLDRWTLPCAARILVGHSPPAPVLL